MLELAGILVFGIGAQWLAWRLNVPAILPLILIGLAVGPFSTYFTADGSKLITPVYDDVAGIGLFPGKLLYYFTSLSIGIILFEGGLTLKRSEIIGVGPAIMKLISLGSAITFIGAALAAHYLIDLNWSMAFLFSALIIVTGPTVIGPILRNVPLKRDVSTILKWEGILIDPIGALVAVLVFNFITTGGNDINHYSSHAFGQFSKIVVTGVAVGFGMAYLLRFMLTRKLIPHYLLNIFTLATVVFAFALSDVIAHESGLLTVVVFGMVLGNMGISQIKEILHFKESLSLILVAILFILLSANIDMDDLMPLIDWRVFALFVVVVFVLRPITVFVCTRGSNLSTNGKLFVSWVGPRGIVAAGISSLFGLSLSSAGVEDAEWITPLVFTIVLGTVLLNATTAKLIAGWLKVLKESSNGVLIIGASLPGRLIAQYLHRAGRSVVLLDTNNVNVKKAGDLGLLAIEEDVFSDEIDEKLDMHEMGTLLALTGSARVNDHAIQTLSKDYGENGSFRLLSQDEIQSEYKNELGRTLFSKNTDHIQLLEISRRFPEIHEIELKSVEEGLPLLEELRLNEWQCPLMIKREDESIEIISSQWDEIEWNAGDRIAYIGKRREEKVVEAAVVSEDQQG